jgi:hypothetical protein
LARQQIVSLADGAATVQLISDGAADTARLRIIAGDKETIANVRFDLELRPTLMVGLGEFSYGRSAPEISMSGDEEANYRGRLAFYYRGRIFGRNLLTLAFDSSRSLNRVADATASAASTRSTALIQFSAIRPRDLKTRNRTRNFIFGWTAGVPTRCSAIWTLTSNSRLWRDTRGD